MYPFTLLARAYVTPIVAQISADVLRHPRVTTISNADEQNWDKMEMKVPEIEREEGKARPTLPLGERVGRGTGHDKRRNKN